MKSDESLKRCHLSQCRVGLKTASLTIKIIWGCELENDLERSEFS